MGHAAHEQAHDDLGVPEVSLPHGTQKVMDGRPDPRFVDAQSGGDHREPGDMARAERVLAVGARFESSPPVYSSTAYRSSGSTWAIS